MVTFQVNEEGSFLGSYLTDASFNYTKTDPRENVDDVHLFIANCCLTSFLTFLLATLEIKLYLFIPFITFILS